MSDSGPTEQFGEALRAALLAGKFPNPSREGCPADELLKRMAEKHGVLPVGHPIHVHVMQCSPCYRLLEGYRASRRRRRAVAAAAAVFLVFGAGYGAYRQSPWARNLITSTHPPISHAVVDLRPYTVERSDRAPSNAPQPLRLCRCRIQAVFYLPVGVEPGPYEIRILDSELRTSVSTSANAKLQITIHENLQTTIQMTMELQELPVGKYTLAMRRPGDDWRQYPLMIDPVE